MPELTIPGLVFIALVPFILAAVLAWREVAKTYKASLEHQDRMATLRYDQEQRDRAGDFIAAAAVEAVFATEEWAARVGYHDLAKLEYATTYLEKLLDDEGIKVEHEQRVKYIDAALTRVRPQLPATASEVAELAQSLNREQLDAALAGQERVLLDAPADIPEELNRPLNTQARALSPGEHRAAAEGSAD
jgi:uncharacterized protein YicC (UPF0701 family)